MSTSSTTHASSWMSFTGTFYNNDQQSTGKSPGDPAYGITASGRHTQDGVTISVDPRIIPLDSMVQVKYPDGRVENRRADDTGSAIKGHHIDIFRNAPNHHLYQLGTQNVEVRVLY